MKNTSLLLFLALSLMGLIGESKELGANVTVAVIDTGAELGHKALRNHIWTNPGESGKDLHGRDKGSNGIDDDANGWIDDVHGWNFADNNSNVKDTWGHGTHIAGIIAQSPSAQIMVLKALVPGQQGQDPILSSVAAINYAVEMGAQIINYSAGGAEASPEEREALEHARAQHILVIAAAGNEREDMDRHGFYPAAYGLANVLPVAAVDLMGQLLPSSNFGKHSVRIAAQGERILSSLPGGQYGAMTGTSQATALVTQAATLICSRKPACIAEEVIGELLQKGDRSRSLVGKIQNPVVLNTMRVAQVPN